MPALPRDLGLLAELTPPYEPMLKRQAEANVPQQVCDAHAAAVKSLSPDQ